MDEKVMINDALDMAKTGLTTYASAITECANPTLRSAFQQIRNDCEVSQFELYHLAQAKNFYKPAAQATDQEVTLVKNQLTC